MKIIPTSHAESLINSKRSKGKARQEKGREAKGIPFKAPTRSLAHSDSFSLAYINHDELAKFESIFIETNKQKN